MADIAKLRNIAHKLRAWAQEIRRDAEIVAHATSNEDSGLLDSAAKEMEEAADEIERLQSLNGR
jgi:acyl-CoA reductase-like NAD-dependent aldehyde dehydrogenase